MNSKLLVTILVMVTLFSCSKEETLQPVSGIEEYTVSGDYSLEIDAKDITATITLIGAGGGGGGGVDYDENIIVITPMSTGGGGGGGAGNVLVLTGIKLQGNTAYTIQVGEGGTAGSVGNNGSDGGVSYMGLGLAILHGADGGNKGLSSGINNHIGGAGGDGNPAGEKGKDGNEVVNGTAKAGFGGTGGDNISGYGSGGAGGKGTAFSGGNVIEALPGVKGGSGYVKVDWTGKR